MNLIHARLAREFYARGFSRPVLRERYAIRTEAIGSRIYFFGDTFAVKEKIKAMGGHWDGDKKGWWVGKAKQAAAEKLAGSLGTSASGGGAAKKAEDASDIQVVGKARYKGKSYFVRWAGVTKRGNYAFRLVSLDGKLDFWADGSPGEGRGRAEHEKQAAWDKQYQEPKTLRSLQKFVDEKREEEQAEKQRAEHVKKASSGEPMRQIPNVTNEDLIKAFFGDRAVPYEYDTDFDEDDDQPTGHYEGIEVPASLADKWDSGINAAKAAGHKDMRGRAAMLIRHRHMTGDQNAELPPVLAKIADEADAKGKAKADDEARKAQAKADQDAKWDEYRQATEGHEQTYDAPKDVEWEADHFIDDRTKQPMGYYGHTIKKGQWRGHTVWSHNSTQYDDWRHSYHIPPAAKDAWGRAVKGEPEPDEPKAGETEKAPEDEPPKDPEFERLHPRDSEGQFKDKPGGAADDPPQARRQMELFLLAWHLRREFYSRQFYALDPTPTGAAGRSGDTGYEQMFKESQHPRGLGGRWARKGLAVGKAQPLLEGQEGPAQEPQPPMSDELASLIQAEFSRRWSKQKELFAREFARRGYVLRYAGEGDAWEPEEDADDSFDFGDEPEQPAAATAPSKPAQATPKPATQPTAHGQPKPKPAAQEPAAAPKSAADWWKQNRRHLKPMGGVARKEGGSPAQAANPDFERQHPRDHGKFSEKPGGAAGGGQPAKPAAPGPSTASPATPPAQRPAAATAPVSRDVNYHAKTYGVDPHALKARAGDIHEKERRQHLLVDDAVRRVRGGLNAELVDPRKMEAWERSGKDHSTYPGWREFSESVLESYPALKDDGYGGTANAADLWRLFRDGPGLPPGPEDSHILHAAARELRAKATASPQPSQPAKTPAGPVPNDHPDDESGVVLPPWDAADAAGEAEAPQAGANEGSPTETPQRAAGATTEQTTQTATPKSAIPDPPSADTPHAAHASLSRLATSLQDLLDRGTADPHAKHKQAGWQGLLSTVQRQLHRLHAALKSGKPYDVLGSLFPQRLPAAPQARKAPELIGTRELHNLTRLELESAIRRSGRKFTKEDLQQIGAEHEQAIREAMGRGVPVRWQVARDYPHLKGQGMRAKGRGSAGKPAAPPSAGPGPSPLGPRPLIDRPEGEGQWGPGEQPAARTRDWRPQSTRTIPEHVHAAAKEHDVDPQDLHELSEDLWQSQRLAMREREAALKSIRNGAFGRNVDAGRLAKWENAGRDHSTYPGWDEFASEMVNAHPELGLSNSGDPSAELWDLIRRGRQEEPGRDDPDILRAAAEMLAHHKRHAPSREELEAVPFARTGKRERYAKLFRAERIRRMVAEACA